MIQSLLYCLLCAGLLAASIRPLGRYMARVYMNERVFLTPVVGWLENMLYRLCGIQPKQEAGWRGYATAMVLLGVFGFLMLFLIFASQGSLPMNPQGFPGLPLHLSFNAAASFITNTNWQSYGGETTLSYFSQMFGCVVQNYLSAAMSMAVAAALFRGLGRKQMHTLGNPYVDVVRSVLYILLPMSIILALALCSQGVIQNMSAYTPFTTIESGTEMLLPQGPVASQEAIKMLGSNGGGFFNANSAHPFENPTPVSNFLELLALFIIPVSLTYTFGIMCGDKRQGWMLFAAMTLIFLPIAGMAIYNEMQPNPHFDTALVDSEAGNMEGKETRFGITSSTLWAIATTATSNGSVNNMHDSMMPLSGLCELLMMQFGEVIFGGVGSGIYGMLMFVLLTVFMAGLMVGRTPEFLGKKLGSLEIKMASLVILIPSAAVLVGTALALMLEAGRTGISNPGAQGFSEILYAFTSSANNNGSAFAGLSANTPFYNISLAIAMLLGRYGVILPVLVVAGSLAAKNTVPLSTGTLPTHTPMFTGMLVGVVIIIGVLTYIPALSLGPLVEHIRMSVGVAQ